jgi:O-6-methylguanine DNA methyltransferase
MKTIEDDLARLAASPPPRLLAAVNLGTGLVEGYSRYETVLGEVAVTFNPKGVSSVDLFDDEFETRFEERRGRHLTPAQPPAAWSRAIGQALEEGRPGPIPIDFGRLSDFRRQVLEVATTIPRGQVRPYGWLAAQVGKEGAARAVGSTMSHNPIPLIVPCHRVVRSDGRIGAYSLGGPGNKWSLLQSEGADPQYLEEMAGLGVRYIGSDATGVYCHPTCPNVRRIADVHRKSFTSKGSAVSKGFRPCGICHP